MRRNFLLILLGLIVSPSAFSDSPLTSTSFYEAYLNEPMVQYAIETKQFDEKIIEFLLNDKSLVDVKAAVINALGWSHIDDRAMVFKQRLQVKYGDIPLESYSAADLMCLAYIRCMDNYFELGEGVNWIETALNKNPESLTIQMISALINGQVAMDNNWCEVWKTCSLALNMPRQYNDFKTAAVQNIVDYMIIYKPYCE